MTAKQKSESVLFDIDTAVRAIFYGTADGICLYSDAKKAILVNRTFCRMIGFACALYQGQKHIGLIPPEVRDELIRRYPYIFEGREKAGAAFEKSVEREDGSHIHISIRKRLLRLGGQSIQVSTIRDISELEQVRRQREQAEWIIRHDLMNHLKGINMVAQSIERQLSPTEQGSPKRLAHIRLIEDTSKTALDLIDTHRKLRMIENGSYRPREELIDLAACLSEVVTVLRPLAAAKHVTLDMEAAERPTVAGETLLIRQALVNLLGNAIEASPDHQPVTVRLEKGDRERVRIRIHNQGPIPKDIRDRFARKYVSGKPGGVGLGAYSARRFIEAYGGTLSFTTSEEEGTDLTVELPV